MPIHPFVIHFVIAFYSITFLLDLFGRITARREFEKFGFLMLNLSGISVILAVASGLWEETRIMIPQEAASTFENHETLALVTSAIILFQVFWRIGAKNQFKKKIWKIYLILSATGLFFLFAGAYKGGKLVYRYGTGFRQEHLQREKPASRPENPGKISTDNLFYPEQDSLLNQEKNGFEHQ